MTADLWLGPDWFKNMVFPTAEVWASTALNTIDQNRINSTFGGTWFHEALCSTQNNLGK